MFTGLVQEVGTLIALTRSSGEARVEISSAFGDLSSGESVAVNGACLSVTEVRPRSFLAFASSETLARTTLRTSHVGARLNLERATRAGEPLGGHIVTGHVDTTVKLVGRERLHEALRFTFALPADLATRRQIAAKGSIAVDGVSLTVNEVLATAFTVVVIPITSANTTLDGLEPGREVNLETDILAKYVARQLETGGSPGGGIDLEMLRRGGFVRR